MSLDPGETFEHAHRGTSVTTLVEGRVDLVVDGVRTPLKIGDPVRIAAATSHVLVNVGNVVAVVKCIHESGEPART